jgi:hypothetical protein
MRLSTHQLKEGLVHPSPVVRDAVAGYFESSFCTDPEVTRQAMRAIEDYGWDGYCFWFHRFTRFPLDTESLVWVIQQIHRISDEGRDDRLIFQLSGMVAKAPVEILAPQKELLLHADQFMQEDRELMVKRLELTNVEPEECWRRLEEHCDSIANADDFKEARIPEAKLLLEPIARHGHALAPRVIDTLALDVDALEWNDPRRWMVGLMIILAGQMRLGDAVDHIYKQFYLDWDWYNEEVMYALTRIATPRVMDLVRENYGGEPWYVRNFLNGILEDTHVDSTVDTMLEIVDQEEDESLRGRLGVGLAQQFDQRGADRAKQLFLECLGDRERGSIRDYLVALSYLAGYELSERDEWESQIIAEMEKRKQKAADFDEWMQNLLDDEPGKTRRLAPPIDVRFDDRHDLDEPFPAQPTFVRDEPRVGRNDPCPCGSGKKYKKCCLRADRQISISDG